MALKSTLSLSEKEANRSLIRAYATVPASEPSPDTNLCYYFLQTEPSAPLLQESSLDSSLAEVFSYQPCRLVLVFYGQDCERWALHCRSFIFLDGVGKPRHLLRSVGLFLIPSPPPPSIAYEETSKTFRKRADLVIQARLVDISAYGSVISRSEETVDTISVSPSVEVHVSSP